MKTPPSSRIYDWLFCLLAGLLETLWSYGLQVINSQNIFSFFSTAAEDKIRCSCSIFTNIKLKQGDIVMNFSKEFRKLIQIFLHPELDSCRGKLLSRWLILFLLLWQQNSRSQTAGLCDQSSPTANKMYVQRVCLCTCWCRNNFVKFKY